jgi:hypothetical protein
MRKIALLMLTALENAGGASERDEPSAGASRARAWRGSLRLFIGLEGLF